MYAWKYQPAYSLPPPLTHTPNCARVVVSFGFCFPCLFSDNTNSGQVDPTRIVNLYSFFGGEWLNAESFGAYNYCFTSCNLLSMLCCNPGFVIFVVNFVGGRLMRFTYRLYTSASVSVLVDKDQQFDICLILFPCHNSKLRTTLSH